MTAREVREAFTPGPWAFVVSRLQEIGLKRKHWMVGRCDGDRRGVALVFGDDEANARLISTAPQLVEALRELLSHISPSDDVPDAVRAQARAALAAACGEKP